MKWIQSFSFFMAVLFLFEICTPIALAEDKCPIPDIDGSVSGSLPDTEDSTAAGAVILTGFDTPERTDAVAFALGTSKDALADWFADYSGGFTAYDAQGNAYDFGTDTWSLENVDTGTPGVYYASAAPNLGDGYVLADGVSLPRQLCAVSIQTPGRPDINCCVSARGFLHFPWVLTPEQQEQLDQFTVRLRKNGGEWAQLSKGFLFVSDSFQLSQNIFEQDCSYDLQVFYPGGRTGILSFKYDGELVITDYAGGDRDGGDVGGSDASTDKQPAPVSTPTSSDNSDGDNAEPEESAASTGSNSEPVKQNSDTSEVSDNTEPAANFQNKSVTQTKTASTAQNTASAVQESYSPTLTVISGLRLRDLCADDYSVVFGEGDLTVSIPSELLRTLNLKDTDTLSVKLTQSESHQVTLAVEASGSSITALAGTVLRLRYTPQSKNAAFTVWNEERVKIADAEYDGEFLHFSVDTAGTYTILETAEALENTTAALQRVTVIPQDIPAVPGGKLPMLPLVGGGLLIAAGGTMLVRRKRHG